MIEGKSNERKLNFGESPFTIYQNLAEFLISEINNINKNNNQNNTINDSNIHFNDIDSKKSPQNNSKNKAKNNSRNNNENNEAINSQNLANKIKEIVFNMNKINTKINSLPVFKCPEKTKLKQKKKIKSENAKLFKCEICCSTFENGQGLGGHMSRTHPNSSLKFNKKKETRDHRQNKRGILYEAKAILLKKYNLNYNELSKTIEGKQIIRKTVKDNKNEYMGLRKQLKFEANLRGENILEYEDEDI